MPTYKEIEVVAQEICEHFGEVDFDDLAGDERKLIFYTATRSLELAEAERGKEKATQNILNGDYNDIRDEDLDDPTR